MRKASFFITSFFILICSEFTFSQSKEIKEVICKNGYDYIPVSYLTDTTIGGILCPLRWLLPEDIEDTKDETFLIYWYSVCTDGTYYLKITPEQIYLTDGHENPNPNHLYWVLPIDSLVYQQIIKGRKFLFEHYNNSQDEETLLLKDRGGVIRGYRFEYCDTLLEQQIDKLFSRLNKLITDETKKLDKTKRIIPKNPIYYSSGIKEFELWINNKR